MRFVRDVKLYMWKNGLQKRRKPCESICEVVCPVILVVLLTLLYLVIPSDVEPAESYENRRYSTSNRPFATLLGQLQRTDHFIAIAPDNINTDAMIARIDAMYPAVDLKDAFDTSALTAAGVDVGSVDWTIPSFSSRVKKFASEAALEEHVRATGYDDVDPVTGKTEKIFAGVVFYDFAPNYNYKLRVNHSMTTNLNEDEVDEFAKKANFFALDVHVHGESFAQGITDLFEDRVPSLLTLQHTIDRAIINKPATSATASDRDYQNYIFSLLYGLLEADSPQYTSITDAVNTSATTIRTQLMKPDTMAPQKLDIYAFPTPSFTATTFYDLSKDVFAFLFVLCMLFPVSNFIREVVLEKETRVREGMMMMGMSTAALNTAWFLTYALVFAVIALMVTLVGVGTMFDDSNAFLVFMLFFLFGIASTMFSYLISAFFSRSKTAAVVGMMVYFFSLFPLYALTSTDSKGTRLAAALSPTIAFAMGVNGIAELESDGIGATFDTATRDITNYTIENMLWMLVLDSVICFVLGWYAYEVMPSEFGVARMPWFPCTRSYWQGVSAEHARTVSASGAGDGGGKGVDMTRFEAPTAVDVAKEEANQCIKVSGLVKRFRTPGGIKTAVDRLSLTMYEGQITALLGHNGAGKTTTISMLTGLLAPSGGDATIYGKSIKESMDELRSMMGVCPQHNVLWDDLTVKEHLQYFGGIKGVSPEQLDSVVRTSIQEVGLVEKTNVVSGSLSGGQKRKLSVAIALIGDSKIVFLDEPTSGMDPYSRRSVWNVLKSKSKGRIMILTTHFMDEADLLGDRIAIMAEGSLRCVGSPMFLKHRYGVGYSMTLVKKEGCVSQAVKQTIRRFVPDSKVMSDVGAEISFQLPLGASDAFPAMMQHLDDSLEGLGVESYGIGVTTMEEVFLKVAAHGDEGFLQRQSSKRLSRDNLTAQTVQGGGEDEAKPEAVQRKPVTVNVAPAHGAAVSMRSRTERNMFGTHLYALLQKRARFFFRDPKSMLYAFVIPIAALIGGIALLGGGAFSDQPSVLIGTSALNEGSIATMPTPYVNDSSPIANSILNNMPSYISPVPLSTSTVSQYFTYDELTSDTAGLNSDEQVIRSLSGYLLDTRTAHKASRYVAYYLQGDLDTGIKASYMVNTTATLAAPLFCNFLSTALYRIASGDSTADITMTTHPLPLTATEEAVSGSVNALFTSLFVVIAFAFIPAAFIVYVVKERSVSAKHQQFLSGVSIPAYWLSNYIYDCAIYLIPGGAALVVLLLFDVESFVDDGTFPVTVLLFLLYGPSSAAFCYFTNFAFSSHSKAQNFVQLLNLLCVFLMLASFIMQQIESTRDVDAALRYVWRLMPGFCLGEGLLGLSQRLLVRLFFGSGADDSPFSWDVALKPIVFMAVESVVYVVGAIAVDYAYSTPRIRASITSRFQAKVKDAPYEEDEDVANEAAHPNPNDAIRLNNVRKMYSTYNIGKCEVSNKVAVKQLSFGVRRGECFGFLGINGAGKTTTLQILSGDAVPTTGTATICGLDIMTEQLSVRRLLGYCPQFDALLDLLTVREHLELYGRIKGLTGDASEQMVQKMMREMDLTQFEKAKAGTLSGGNKRKLSVAIAMMGSPPVMFLDEPSTGMDPKARRYMWSVIERMAKTSSVILVSHSMEECEALCNRVGIMVGGRLRCVGSVQHLKNRFGQGFHLEMKLALPTPERQAALLEKMGLQSTMTLSRATINDACQKLGDPARVQDLAPLRPGWLMAQPLNIGALPAGEFAQWWAAETDAAVLAAFIAKTFPGSELSERHGNRLWFKVPQLGVRLGHMFSVIELNKAALHVEEYALSQTSLEQIFNSFAAQQEEETGTVQGMAQSGEGAATLVVNLPSNTAIPSYGVEGEGNGGNNGGLVEEVKLDSVASSAVAPPDAHTWTAGDANGGGGSNGAAAHSGAGAGAGAGAGVGVRDEAVSGGDATTSSVETGLPGAPAPAPGQ